MKPETVIGWNKAYCWSMVVFYLIVSAACFNATSGIDLVYATIAEQGYDVPKSSLILLYQVVGVYGIIMAGLSVALVFVPRTKMWWLAHLINHAAGILKCCCIPFAIPMLIMWLRKDVQSLFDEGKR